MKDPALDSKRFEWDTACPADQWRHSHNYMHHTRTTRTPTCKDLGTKVVWRDARWVKPIWEIDACGHVLAHQALDTARVHGAHSDPARDRYWLFLGQLNAVPLWQVG